jgi:hypothetical protein
MRRLALVLTLLLAGVALAQAVRTQTFSAQRATFRSAGDAGTTPVAADFTQAGAFELGNVCGFRATLCSADPTCFSNSGCAVLTGGTLKPWMLRPGGTVPTTNPDLNLVVGTPGSNCRTWADQRVAMRGGGKLLFAPSAITGTHADAGSLTVDGGNFTITVDGWTCP